MNDRELLRLDGLCRYFGHGKEELRAVDNVSFTVERGEVFGLVGESGCGKTTTGRTVIGLYPPTKGRIYFDGELIADAENKKMTAADKRKRAEIRRRIQMIFQDPVASLDGRMTVSEIISEGLVIAGERDKKTIGEKVDRMLELVGLMPEHGSRYPHEFSGGQRQRIGIARALIMEPELIIADEPISALDVSIQAQIINLLSKLKRELSVSILFIAHDLSVVKYFCDRVGVMYAGRLVETADSKQLFDDPLHPYTKALLSAIPHPDPIYERSRKREVYDPEAHRSNGDMKLYEVYEGHSVLCTEEELSKYRRRTE